MKFNHYIFSPLLLLSFVALTSACNFTQLEPTSQKNTDTLQKNVPKPNKGMPQIPSPKLFGYQLQKNTNIILNCSSALRRSIWTDCKGEETDRQGNRYTGFYKDGLWDGQGTLTFANGNRYIGSFQKGKYHGTGKFEYSSGDIYTGDFKNGMRDGHGRYSSPNIFEYVGEFTKNIQQGLGTVTFGTSSLRSGDKYSGEWQNGIQHGQGTYFFADGRTKQGVWHNARLKNENKFTGDKSKNTPPSKKIIGVDPKTSAHDIEALDKLTAKNITLFQPWGIQVGAYTRRDQAVRAANTAMSLVPAQLQKGLITISPVLIAKNKTLYRARIYGLKKKVAHTTCRSLKQSNHPCIAVKKSTNDKFISSITLATGS
ncbi:MAG: hypothetical protein CBB68_03080 [Rhodospirillaceae bacterium TMED8]|nr:hypothetical protein [Magnetovibrio sp.]OUT52351.1 MAG: hypothetical protein CBB68_03080 [Rhodospirillaceae bacterium TMED8]